MGAGSGLRPDPRIPTFRANANHLWFENTATLEALRVEGTIPKDIGWDVSAGDHLAAQGDAEHRHPAFRRRPGFPARAFATSVR